MPGIEGAGRAAISNLQPPHSEQAPVGKAERNGQFGDRTAVTVDTDPLPAGAPTRRQSSAMSGTARLFQALSRGLSDVFSSISNAAGRVGSGLRSLLSRSAETQQAAPPRVRHQGADGVRSVASMRQVAGDVSVRGSARSPGSAGEMIGIVQSKIHEDLNSLKPFIGTSNPGSARSTYDDLAKNFSELFIKDVMRDGIVLNGEILSGPGTNNLAGGIEILQRIVDGFGGDAAFAGRATRGVAQNLMGAVVQAAVSTPAVQSQYIDFQTFPAAKSEAQTIALSVLEDSTVRVDVSYTQSIPDANRSLSVELGFFIDATDETHTSVEIADFSMTIGSGRS